MNINTSVSNITLGKTINKSLDKAIERYKTEKPEPSGDIEFSVLFEGNFLVEASISSLNVIQLTDIVERHLKKHKLAAQLKKDKKKCHVVVRYTKQNRHYIDFCITNE